MSKFFKSWRRTVGALLIVFTVICCVPFVTMLAIYASMPKTTTPAAGANIGLGMLILSSYPIAMPILPWLVYAFFATRHPRHEGDVGTYRDDRFFSGWRRKLGIVFLGVACFLCAGWVRSYSITDEFRVYGGSLKSTAGFVERSVSTSIVVGNIGGFNHNVYWTVPYSSIVIPLTLLSTWLLLYKPRAGVSKSTAEFPGVDGK